MDGLLVDSEPSWNKAAAEVFAKYNVQLSPEEYTSTTGLRTKEFVHWWFTHFNIPMEHARSAQDDIVQKVVEDVSLNARILPGVDYIMEFFRARDFKIGMATSSPLELADIVIKKAGIKGYLLAVNSAEDLPLGKPHPQVYLDCAKQLLTEPTSCICFEDSFNGMIAAKAARMKCVVVPSAEQVNNKRWGASDAKLSSLEEFNELLLFTL